MKQEALSQFQHPEWVAWASVLFLMAFVIFVVRAVWIERKVDVDNYSKLPLNEE